MDKSVQWFIGKEGISITSVSTPPFRAYFCWLKDGQIVKAHDYDMRELELLISELDRQGEVPAYYRDALIKLRTANP